MNARPAVVGNRAEAMEVGPSLLPETDEFSPMAQNGAYCLDSAAVSSS